MSLPLILLTHTNHDDLERNYIYLLLNSFGTPNVMFKTNDRNLYHNAILNQTGAGFYVKSLAGSLSLPKGITLVPLRENALLYHHYIISKTSKHSQIIQAFTSLLSK